MIKFSRLNSLKFNSTTDAEGFKSPYNSLYENQKRGVFQLHQDGIGTRNVVGFNSVINVQVENTYASADIDSVRVTFNGVEKTVTVTNLADTFYDFNIDLNEWYPYTLGKNKLSVEVRMYDGSDFSVYFESEYFYVMSKRDQNTFFDDSRAFGISYSGDDYYKGHYWGDNQILLFDNVYYIDLDSNIEAEKSTDLNGIDEILDYDKVDVKVYKFYRINEYMYDKIIRALQMPNCYVNGKQVSLESIDKTRNKLGLLDFTVSLKDGEFETSYQEDSYTDYLVDFETNELPYNLAANI